MEKNEAKIKFLEIPFGMDSCPVRKKFDRRLHRKSTIVERLCFLLLLCTCIDLFLKPKRSQVK